MTMVIQADIRQSERIERLVLEGSFQDASQVLDKALDLLEAETKLNKLREKVLYGLRSGGETELTDELIAEMDARLIARYEARKPSSLDDHS
jgi:Arc/MetJ-type ribon-helix-helix transcriptional regulator